MCFSIPAKVISIEGRYGTVEWFGRRQRVIMDLVDAKPDDYIYVQGGLGISVVPSEQALEVLKLWEDSFDLLEQRDKEKAEDFLLNKAVADKRVQNIISKAVKNRDLSDKDAIVLLNLKSKNDIRALLDTANWIRHKNHGNACCVHGIIEFSNNCTSSCFYCGINSSSKIERYRMSLDDIIKTSKEAVERFGFKAILIQSGEDPFYDEDSLIFLTEKLRGLGILVFLSIGMKSIDTYKKLYNKGARACLLRFETSNKRIFENLRPKSSYDERISLIFELKKMGFILATGFLIGLPEETDIDLINNIRLTKKIKPDMWSFGPFLPVEGTPLEGSKPPDFDRVLKTIAISRLFEPDSNILVTTAMEVLDNDATRSALLAGANSLMTTLTPSVFRRLYRIYNRPSSVFLDTAEQITRLTELLLSLGRSPMDVSVTK